MITNKMNPSRKIHLKWIRMNRAMAKILTHTRMIRFRGMVNMQSAFWLALSLKKREPI